MTTDALDQALAEAVGAANCAKAQQLAQFAVDGTVPQAAVFPSSAEELSGVMKLAAAEGLALLPRGGGTAMAMGNPPERLGIVVGTRRMNHVVAHEAADLTATVEAGVSLRDLDAALSQEGQGVHLDAPLPERATIGGVLAANTTGPRRLGFGAPRDRLIGIRVVDAQGTLIKGGGKVVKNVAGYDLNKLFTGSMGTLGVIVEATFKLAPMPKSRAAMVGGFSKLEEAMTAVEEIRAGWSRPLALELLNRTAYEPVAARAGTPSIADRDYILAVDLGGGPAAVERQKADIHKAMVGAGGKSMAVEGPHQYEAFWRALIDLGRREDGAASMITRCSVLLTQIPPLVHGHEALAEGGRLEVGIDVHLASGTIRAYWWGENRGAADHAMLAETVPTLRTAAGHVAGAFVVESCPLPVKRTLDVWGPLGPDLAIMQRLKQQFDPQGILSPGRFVGGI